MNEIVNSVKKILERIHSTSMTVHDPDYCEHKRANTPSVCPCSDKQAVPRFPQAHALYILSSSGL